VKKETGKSPQAYIQDKVIGVAKESVPDSSKSISEIAYGIGFSYPSHFSRLFKQLVGQSPQEYQSLHETRTSRKKKKRVGLLTVCHQSLYLQQ
jgi:AraC-like DNA-binding protein